MSNLHIKETVCNHIVNQVESKKKIHKYRIEIPTRVDHSYEIDKKKNGTLWQDAICKEMHNVGINF